MARPLQSHRQPQHRVRMTMAKIQEKTCEVIGWLLDGEDNSQVLVRERDGQISLQTASLDSTFGRHAVQTGCFRRGNPIIDPVTHETLGYEMVSVENPLVGLGTL
jgi:hypothetical protein